MKKNVFVLTTLILVIFLIAYFFWRGIYLPKDFALTEDKLFSIEKGESLFQIAENLEKEGLIKNRFFFVIYIISKGAQKKLQAGEYYLNSSANIIKISQKIISGDVVKITVTIPEGFTVKQIEEKLGIELPNKNLEGFLFPDTYQFPLHITGEEVMKKMQDNFEKKMTPLLREEIKRQGKTIFEIVIMASLVEKEVKTLEDKKLVSGILWKRLETGMPLQVDATIAYILNGKSLTFNEMRRQITIGKEIDSPYNTYKYLGLPPGPICNPGLESIIAAIYPEESDYWYYLSTPEGETIFSKTLQEHNLAKAKYY